MTQQGWGPRDPRNAGLAVLWMATAAVTTTTMSAVLVDSHVDNVAAVVVPLLFLALAIALPGVLASRHPVAWTLAPLTAVVAVTGLNTVTEDTSTGAAVSVLFPVVFAASQLARRPAVMVAVTTLVAHGASLFLLLPPTRALVDLLYVAGSVITFTGLFVLAGERQDRLTAKLRSQAAVDQLTGLVNRRVLDEAARAALMRPQHDEQGTALVLIDLDEFKYINDAHGHPVGDDVLVFVSRSVEGVVRPTDVVSRLGGDELAVLMPCTSLAEAAVVAQRLLVRVTSRPFVTRDTASHEEIRLDISASVGVAHAPTDGTDLRQLYAAADTALYRAKNAGRRRVAVSGPASDGDLETLPAGQPRG